MPTKPWRVDGWLCGHCGYDTYDSRCGPEVCTVTGKRDPQPVDEDTARAIRARLKP